MEMASRFGAEMRKQFMINEDVTPINNGSWGKQPKRVHQARVRLLEEVEGEVDVYQRYKWEDLWFENLRVVCDFLGLDFKNTTFVNNATTGINTILKLLPLKAGDEILAYTYTYAAISKTIECTATKSGASVITMDMTYKIKDKQEVIDRFTATFNNHPNIKVAVIDHISSGTATLFPVKELCAICRERGVISVVDGAHAPGQVKIDVDDIKPDFYTGNLHKWMYSPRGTAILWMDPKYQDIVRPLVTSHYYKLQPFQKEFCNQGTADSTGYNVTKEAVAFYKDIGGQEVVHKYITTLLNEAVEYLVKLWGTEKLPIPRNMEAPFMRLIKLPNLPGYPIPNENLEKDVDDHRPLNIYLIQKKKIETVMLTMKSPDNTFDVWVRITGQVYNAMDDYRELGQEILQLSKE